MNKMMKAVVLKEHGEKCYMDVPVPEVGDDDILLEVKAAGICGGDMAIYYGKVSVPNPPIIMGHEFAGVIAYKGKNVEGDWKVGNRVVSENTADLCGVCPSCRSGNFVNCQHRKVMGYTNDGIFTKYVKLSGHLLHTYPNCLFHLPDNISFAEGSVLEPTSNGYKALIQEGGLKPGETVVIFGAGPLALMPIQLAKIAGADKIIVVGLTSDKKMRFDVAKKYGATHFITSDTQDPVAEVEKIAGKYGVRLAIDSAGFPDTTKAAVAIVHNEGTVVRVGNPEIPYNYSLNDFTMKSVTLRGHMGYNTESWINCIKLAASGQLDLKSIITCELPMSEYDKGFSMVRSGEAAKVVLIPED